MTRSEIRQLLDSPERPALRYFPHVVAQELSDLAAVLLYDLHGRISRQRKKNIKDGRTWTFDAMRVFAQAHPYASESGIRKAFLTLEKAGLIEIEKSGKYNRKKYDEKWWYHVNSNGSAAAGGRRIRFNPEVAAALDIPKAVLLETCRYELHREGAGEYVVLNPSVLRVPHSPKTVGRHLEQLVQDRLLEPHPSQKWAFRLPPMEDRREKIEPLTVAPERLLPPLRVGQRGLLVGHSGTGKTSFSCFAAVQCALAGSKVLYVTLEEPLPNILDRVYAQESGALYSGLHQGRPEEVKRVQEWLSTSTERMNCLKDNFQFVDLSAGPVEPKELLDAIQKKHTPTFAPDLILVDQLERMIIGEDESSSPEADDASEQRGGRAVGPALVIRECLADLQCAVWILHQAMGECELTFPLEAIAGGAAVAEQFDTVVGLGRETRQSRILRAFSMTPASKFEQTFATDFPHMRFLPRETP